MLPEVPATPSGSAFSTLAAAVCPSACRTCTIAARNWPRLMLVFSTWLGSLTVAPPLSWVSSAFRLTLAPARLFQSATLRLRLVPGSSALNSRLRSGLWVESMETRRGPALTQAPAVQADWACARPRQESTARTTSITSACQRNDDAFTPFTLTMHRSPPIFGRGTPWRRDQRVVLE